MHVYIFHNSNEIAVCLTTKAKTTEGRNIALKTQNIYNLSGCAHWQIPQRNDKTWSTFRCKILQMLFPFTGFFDLSNY